MAGHLQSAALVACSALTCTAQVGRWCYLNVGRWCYLKINGLSSHPQASLSHPPAGQERGPASYFGLTLVYLRQSSSVEQSFEPHRQPADDP
mmetsp:Transcript_87903/g.160930  ORF Transcript_87903/g.160930 Transcript_87903/m.160930 type:complete len:92 (+) Transcript_87903:67-342(+)